MTTDHSSLPTPISHIRSHLTDFCERWKTEDMTWNSLFTLSIIRTSTIRQLEYATLASNKFSVKGAIRGMGQVWSREGMVGLFRGGLTNMIPLVVIPFLLERKKEEGKTPWKTAAISFTAQMAAYPLVYAANRIMINPQSFPGALKCILRTANVRSLYTGSIPYMVAMAALEVHHVYNPKFLQAGRGENLVDSYEELMKVYAIACSALLLTQPLFTMTLACQMVVDHSSPVAPFRERVKQILAVRGWRGFYGGGVAIGGAIVTLFVIELLLLKKKKMEEKEYDDEKE